MTTVSVVMPAFNEEEGIESFLTEMASALDTFSVRFIVVDDKSTDQTAATLDALSLAGFPVAYETNPVNSGHGPSTLRALELGLESLADIVVAIDGDGQFIGSDVCRLVVQSDNGRFDVVEGVRQYRNDPLYRRATSLATRMLVRQRAKSRPADANTPLRVYRRPALERLLPLIPKGSMVPNLHMSVETRRLGFKLLESPVRSQPRRGASVVGSSWGRGSLLPSKRFMKFTRGALAEWFAKR